MNGILYSGRLRRPARHASRGWLMAAAAALLVAGCKGKQAPEKGPKLTDTGWFKDTSVFDPQTCPHVFDFTIPEDGDGGWYYRDVVKVYVKTDNHSWYQINWVDSRGVRVDHEVVWDESGLVAELRPGKPLGASTEYTLQLTDCRTYTEVTFTTSDLGEPLEGRPQDLIGRTFNFDFQEATWLEPGGIEQLLALYFTTPVLIGVTYADEQRIDLLGAPGDTDLLGKITQDTTQSTWDIPTADFGTRPYFEATSGSITLESGGVVVPVDEFRISGTISGDMTEVGGGELSGLGDTRYLGELFYQPDNPNAACELLAPQGVNCIPCSDGERYCLFLRAVDLHGSLLPEVQLLPIN